MHSCSDDKALGFDLSDHEWKGTTLPGTQLQGKVDAGPHQGLPGKPIDPTADETDTAAPGGERDEV